MKLLVTISVLLLAFVAADEAQPTDLMSLVEAGATLPNEFTICLLDRPMMCLAPAADAKSDGTALLLADRMRTPGQQFRLESGVLKFADITPNDRVIAAEHGAQNAMDSQAGGRVWIWKQQELAFEQQWNANEDPAQGSAQLCMRAFPKACLYTNYPKENKVIIANADHARTLWTIRPVKPCAVSPCDGNAKCSEQPDGLAKCTCNDGFKLGADNKCFEVDLCANPATNPCDVNAACAKTGPAKASCTCHTAYEGKGGKGECKPVDACKAKVSPCDGNSVCSPTGPNLFKCSCKPGYVPTSPTQCQELDLCATANPCAATATCTKTGPGKVSCQCNPGYAGNGQQCSPVDGCEGTPCGAHATCVRQPLGGRQCNCDTGFEVDKKSKQFRCQETNPCGLKGAAAVCKGRNSECKKTGPGTHKCLCKSGYLAFWNGNCEKPGSKEALEASAAEGSESARQELIIQQRKAKEAEIKRKEMEMEFRRKQKEREENIRALERRIRELIHEKTNARVQQRDTRIASLSDRVSQLQTQQAEASKTAEMQLKLIKAMEAQESGKVSRLTAALNAATDAVKTQAVAYATKLRESTRARLAAELAVPDTPEPAPAPKPEKKKVVATKAKPADPPRYGDNFSSKPLKLPIGKPSIAVTHSAKAAAAAYIANTTPAPAPKPKAAKPLYNPAEVNSRFQQVHITSEAEVQAAAEQQAESQAEIEAIAQSHAQAQAEAHSEVEQHTELSAESSLESTVQAEVEALAHSEGEVEQSDEDLAEQLAALHNEVDSHLESVLASEHDEENENESFLERDAQTDEEEEGEEEEEEQAED